MSVAVPGRRSRPNAFYRETGVLLRKIRYSRGLTAAAVARSIGCAEQTVRSWEVGGRRIPCDMIMPLCDTLRITPEFLLRTGHTKVSEL